MANTIQLNIPESAHGELLLRLEDGGAQYDDRAGLYAKLQAGRRILATNADLKELEHHCEVMIAIAVDDYSGLDPVLNREAAGARALLKRINQGKEKAYANQ